MFRVIRPLWRALPARVRQSTTARRVKILVGGLVASPVDVTTPAAIPPVPAGPRLISTLEELDAALRELDRAAAISDDDLRRGFQTFAMRPPSDLPKDPDSDAYRRRQLEFYEWLHGKPYAVANEVSQFDPVTAADAPFPYHTHSPGTVGDQFIAIGFLIRTMNLAPGSRILEFGPGWGNTTLALARMGYHVTAIDIERNFLRLIEERARRIHATVETLHGDFSSVSAIDRQFDAVLFFESFHHCANHQALITALDRVVAPGGKIVFAGEPISDGCPLPWGLRLDGGSLWSIRRHGWLELGFEETYFRGLLARAGWHVDKQVCAELTGDTAGWGTVFTATRAS